MRPVDPITLAEAARILRCSPSSVERHIAAGRLTRRRRRYKHAALSRAEVEELAGQLYDWRRPNDNPDSYWVTGQRAADVLGVSRARLGQLARADRVPYVRVASGRRLYRRAQLEVMSRRWVARHEVADCSPADRPPTSARSDAAALLLG